jgi:uncharacterized protein YukE
MGNFNQQTVNEYGGVAWAKQVAESMDPGAIETQIQSYQSAASTLSHLQTTLQNVKNNLASSWTGDAADQAQQSFQDSVNHAQLVQDTINQAIIPPLQTAKSAQQAFVTKMASVPNEQTVPSNSVVDDVEGFFGAQTPAQKAQAHNTAARTQAADAINTLSDSYDSSASQLGNVQNEGQLTPSGGDEPFSIGPTNSTTGNGAASGYSNTVNGGGATTKAGYVPPSSTGKSGDVSDPSTSLSGTHTTTTNPPPADTIWGTSPSTTTETTPVPNPTWEDPDPIDTSTGGSYNKSGLITDDPDEGTEISPGGNLGEENLSGGGTRSQSGVFDETGMSDGELTGGTGIGMRGGTSTGDGSSLVGDGAGTSGGVVDEGGTSGTGMAGGMGRGMGMGAEDEELGPSRYSRGRFFDEEDDGSSSSSPLRSVYENATDADGNRVNMMGPGRRGVQEDDEEDERGKRPSYLKEDEFWKNAQRIVPPVIQ